LRTIVRLFEEVSMKIRWLGWAGFEIEAEGERLVVDPLHDARAVFAWMGERAADMSAPSITAPQPGALAGLLTHLHRDHADAAALVGALAPGSQVYEPVDYGGGDLEQAAVAQADHELAAVELTRHPVAAWTSAAAGPFTVTALPAVDGTGDPQVSWLIEAGGQRVLHLGDTMWHGWWWRIAERYGAPDVVLAPINGARLTFPHRRPASPLAGAMEPEQAALAADILKAERLIPMHYGGYDLPGTYEPVPDAADRAQAASDRTLVVDVGDAVEI
jgi:L-ascorbate metabolism protein UlaG (beta-lactamase superfamily)